MSKDALRSHLEQLHRELAAARQLDDGTRAQLAEVAAQIERILAEAEAETDVDADSARDEIEATALRFEAEHPNFARILSDITDTLAKLGI